MTHPTADECARFVIRYCKTGPGHMLSASGRELMWWRGRAPSEIAFLITETRALLDRTS